MADQIQRYTPNRLSNLKRWLVRTDTAHIYIPGNQYPARVEFTRPRWWPLSLLMVGAVIGTAFVVTRLLTSSVTIPAERAQHTACVPDTVRLVVSQIKDRLRVLVGTRFIKEIKFGEVVNLDGSVERTFTGPGWGDVDLSPYLPPGNHVIRLIAIHEQGTTAGAVAEVKHNGKTIRVLSHRFGFHDRLGNFADQTIPITIQTCTQESSHERAAAER